MNALEIAEKLREFEMSDEVGDGDFGICHEAADKLEELLSVIDQVAGMVRCIGLG